MTEKEVFDQMTKDQSVLLELSTDPIKEAVFFALHDFVKQGNALGSLPWFALTGFGMEYKDMLASQKAAA